MGLSSWNGPAVSARIARASVEAVNETTEAAVEAAQQEHWWTKHTGHLIEETVNEPAKLDRTGVSGRFGTTRRRGFYGLFLELKQPFLRPAADETFPTLRDRIREKLAE